MNSHTHIHAALKQSLLVVAGLLATGLVNASDADDNEVRFGYCTSSASSAEGPRLYVSDIYRLSGAYRAKYSVYSTAIENDFYSYLNANYSDPQGRAICSISAKSYREAERERNDEIGSTRRRGAGWTVITVPWVYYED